MFSAILILIIGFRIMFLILKYHRADFELCKKVFHIQISISVLFFIFYFSFPQLLSLSKVVVGNLIFVSMVGVILHSKAKNKLDDFSLRLIEDSLVSLKMGESLEHSLDRFFEETDAIKQHKAIETIKNVLFAQQIPDKTTTSDSFNLLLHSLLLCLNNSHKNLFILEKLKQSILTKKKMELKKRNLTQQISFQITTGSFLFLAMFAYQYSIDSHLLNSVFVQIAVTFFVSSILISLFLYRRFS